MFTFILGMAYILARVWEPESIRWLKQKLRKTAPNVFGALYVTVCTIGKPCPVEFLKTDLQLA